MRRPISGKWTLGVLAILSLPIQSAAQASTAYARSEYACDGVRATDADIAALGQAATDEIYAAGHAVLYTDLPAKGDSVLMYVNPRKCGHTFFIIYKLLPYGEVLRGGWYLKDSLMTLAISPTLGFQVGVSTAVRTLYLRDDEVEEMKASWKRVWFRVERFPSRDVVDAARARQARREHARLPS